MILKMEDYKNIPICIYQYLGRKLYTLRPQKHGRHFAEDILNRILEWNCRILNWNFIEDCPWASN